MAKTRLTDKETEERKEQVSAWIDEGLNVHDIARKLDLTPLAVKRWLNRRGWETHSMRDYRLRQEAKDD